MAHVSMQPKYFVPKFEAESIKKSGLMPMIHVLWVPDS